MSITLLEQVNKRYIEATSFHCNQANVFHYLALGGFNALHEYQYICESLTQRKIKRFIISTYHQLKPDEVIEDFKPQTQNKLRLDLTSTDVWQCVKNCFIEYRKWESSTLEYYESITKQLSGSGDIIGYDFVKTLAIEVHAELTHLTDMILGYNAIEWDLSQITDDQDTLLERYRYLMSKIIPLYEAHHFNSDVSWEKRGIVDA